MSREGEWTCGPVCPECGAEFDTETGLCMHKTRMHGSETEEDRRELSRRSGRIGARILWDGLAQDPERREEFLAGKAELTREAVRKRSAGILPRECEVCGKVLVSNEGGWAAHMRSHSDDPRKLSPEHNAALQAGRRRWLAERKREKEATSKTLEVGVK